MNKKLLTAFVGAVLLFGFSHNVSAKRLMANPASVAEVNAAAAEATATETIDITKLDVETSSDNSTAGDITEDTTLVAENFSVTISPKASGNTPNRFWATTSGTELRVYNGTITVKAAAGKTLNKIEFDQSRWGTVDADNGTLDGQIWTGEAETVVFTVSKQCRIT